MVLELNIPDYTYRIKEVIRVIDGDTVDVMIDLGFYLSARKRIRFLNIDTYELRGGTDETKTLARAAKARLEELLATPDSFVYIKTEMDNTGKYGRLLGKLYVIRNADGFIIDINHVLLEEGFVEHVS
ncbi:hypothetical protein LCGC14_0746410 [marine sediment metagenome]|uniref:TNase-like domain-containing protein n=1 Tax=marine sediment metagenome TaxID=412755 RepID=A0A0F9SQ84_9ZZZZ